jgi:hypothetical protein
VISGGFGVSDGEIGADDVGGAGVVVVVTGADGVVGGADDVGGAGVVVAGVVTGATGVVAGAEGDTLVGGASFVGVGDSFLVGVWLGDFDADAVAVRDAVPTVVPGLVSPSPLTGTEAVAGDPAGLADDGEDEWPVLPPVSCAAGGLLLESSSTATTAMTAQAATPIPANRRPPGPRRREPRPRSAAS